MMKSTLQMGRPGGDTHIFRERGLGDHIDRGRMHLNEYYDLTQYSGGELMPIPAGACEHDLIHAVYEREYAQGLELQNRANRSKGHRERCKSLEQLETNAKTRPIECIFQCGNMHDHISGGELREAFEDYLQRLYAMCESCGIKSHLISAALHLDEQTPHIHYKLTLGADVERGGQLPRQEECLRQAGVPLPHPGEPEGRYNNRLITFTSRCRELEHEVLRERGIELDTEPRLGRKHMRTQEYIIQQQAATIERQTSAINHQAQQIRSNNDVLQNQVEQYKENQRLLAAQYEKKSTIEQWIKEQLPQIREQIHATRQQMEELGILDMSYQYLEYVKNHDLAAYEGIMRQGVDGIDAALREVVDAMEDIGIEDI